ncbi:hypothetical protein CR956_01915 [Candidatus Saccharibacteria bacterium]|nr:MAG: hypothetical protein CR956_01915 [Candidatus Saccharibacteria bacterium]
MSSDRFLVENDYFYSMLNNYPVTPGHAMVIPKFHVANLRELDPKYASHMLELVHQTLRELSTEKLKRFYSSNIQNPLDDNSKRLCDDALELLDNFNTDNFNVGVNNGATAGQTVFHLHMHIIPRFQGDGGVSTGGVCHVIPSKGDYKSYAKNNPTSN